MRPVPRSTFRRDEHHAILGEFRHEHIVQQLVLLIDEAHGSSANRLQLFGHRQTVRSSLHGAGLQQLLETGDADLEEFVEVRARDAQKPHSLEQRNTAVLGLIQDALGNLFGTTATGGAYGYGAVFKLAADGTETVLYSFCGDPDCVDGNQPSFGSLVRDRAGNMYGVAGLGADQAGVVFKLTP